MKACTHPLVSAALLTLLSTTPLALAAVTADEAAQLKSRLMPLGGERAGNKDGSIPAWDGGLTAPAPGFKVGGRRPDPYASEKPMFSITTKNMDQYADKLTDGVKAMLKKYPESYRLDIYPTHRTAAAPQWVYENTSRNATRGKLIDGVGGLQPTGVYGGIPFPIPKSGAEVIWNHLLRWRGTSYHWDATQYLTTAAGKRVLINDGSSEWQSPYWIKDGTPETFNGDYYLTRLINAGPPIRAGEGIAGRVNFNANKSASYVYFTGQRRTRKLPNACCDTPLPTTAGVMTFDELEMFQGRIDRFDWKLVGKKEMYIPYNTNRTWTPAKDSDVMSEHHMHPDHLRWELHRVWVVQADLAAGQRHAAVKSLYYIDEDSWYGVLGDRWDAQGQLWRTVWHLPIVAPEVPGIVAKTFGFYDLVSGAWYVNGLLNEKKEQYLVPIKLYRDSLFSPEALASEGVR